MQDTYVRIGIQLECGEGDFVALFLAVTVYTTFRHNEGTKQPTKVRE